MDTNKEFEAWWVKENMGEYLVEENKLLVKLAAKAGWDAALTFVESQMHKGTRDE